MAFALRRVVLTFLGVACIQAGVAVAESCPNKSERIIILFAAGGATDVVFRMLTPLLGQYREYSHAARQSPGAKLEPALGFSL